PQGLQLSGFLHRRPRLKPAAVLLVTSELADLLASGMTLGTALHALAQRKTNTPADVILPTIRDDIVGGMALSAALAKWPESFPPLYIAMVRVGEASGQLPAVLGRLVTHFERAQAVREKVRMALVYPSVVAIIGVLAIIFMMAFVIPQFTKMFAELGGTLPLATRMLIGMSDAVVHYGWAMAIGIVLLVVLVRRALATPAGRAWKDHMALRLPVAAKIVAASAFSNFAHTLETLLTNGVQMLPALGIVESTISNLHIAGAIRDARDRIADGSTLSRPLAQSGLFPRMLTDMLAVGEESGDMATALNHIGARYDTELDRAIKVFTTLLEPIMILGIALGVGFVAVAMLSAVFEMTSGLQH
ncbi:MAG: type II secretion system F family protein, partial [Kiritimatiellae bacterium]|nr:type II secretion system F family protein [Kiritimatiellia bacterium]